MKSLIPYALALIGLGGVAVAQTSMLSEISPLEQPTRPNEAPRRLTINVSVTDPDDLKVTEGDRISVGQLIADRTRDRNRLEAQAKQLDLTLQRLEHSTITPPLPPATPPPIATPTYVEQNAAIDRAKADVDQAEALITAKHQEIDYLGQLPHLEPLVMEHETAKLAELQRDHTAAVRDYQLALGKRSTAEYDHSVTMAADVSSRTHAMLSYQQQWANYEQRLRDRDFQLAQTQLRVDEVENAIANLAVVRSPYAGRIRRIKWLGQGTDGLLSAEITLMVRTGSGTAVPGQFDGVPGDTDTAGNRPVIGD
ncbi:HlyD family secretion protein [Adonisia turfae]